MKRKLAFTGVAVALAGSFFTYEYVTQPAAPQYVYAQDSQYVSLTFAPLVKKTLPAVVSVRSEVRASRSRNPQQPRRRAPQGLPPGLEDFFGFGGPEQQPRGGSGSGVIVSRDGYIITNNHVVEGATEVTITMSDRREFPAKIVGTDPRSDVAVLKIAGTNLPALPISETRVQVGDLAIAIGSPFGLSQTVTMGIISATGRAGLNPGNYEDFIQTDAAINPGNSGGALINTSGQLIGINTMILSRTGGNEGIGFAIPINMAREVMDQLIKGGKVVRGYMGAGVQDLTPELARGFNLPQANGAAIPSVERNSPAERGGLRPGDVVTHVNGEPVADANALRLRISRSAPGSTVKLTVQRPEGSRELSITLDRLPERGAAGEGQGSEDEEEAGPYGRGSATGLEGLSVTELTPEISQQLQLERGTTGVVISRVSPGSAAAEAGLRRGDVIMQVNRRNVATVREFEQAVGRGTGSVLLLVNRGGGTQFVVVETRK
jgi:serine protease Do